MKRKRLAITGALVLLLSIALSSCTQKICPAYAKDTTSEQQEQAM